MTSFKVAKTCEDRQCQVDKPLTKKKKSGILKCTFKREMTKALCRKAKHAFLTINS